MVFTKTVPYIIKNKPTGFGQLVLKDNKLNHELEDEVLSIEEDIKSLQEEIDGDEMEECLFEMLMTVKHSEGLSDLADYYLALRYALNLVDNDLGYGFNQRIGSEMMRAFAKVDNRYAVSFFKLNAKYTRFSSQTVDDK